MATKKTEKKETAKKPAAKAVAKPRAARAPAAKKSAKPAKDAEVPAPTYQMIAQRAYEIWEARGRPAGTEAENWAQAERELRGQG